MYTILTNHGFIMADGFVRTFQTMNDAYEFIGSKKYSYLRFTIKKIGE